jgi:HK97 family phage prohead protease
MRKYEYKDMVGEVVDVDESCRKVKAVWSRMGNIDLDSDIIMSGAFTKTIAECGPMGKNQIWSLIDHKATMGSVIGKPCELYEEGDMLVAVTEVIDTEVGEDVLKMYMAGLINQHSIGFATIKSDWQDQEQTVRLIKECKLYEGSAVLWGANPLTPTLAITKDYFSSEHHDTLLQRFEKLSSIAKKGTFSDKTFSLLEIEIKQIQTLISSLTTLPDIKSVEPQDEILQLLRASNLKLSKFI